MSRSGRPICANQMNASLTKSGKKQTARLEADDNAFRKNLRGASIDSQASELFLIFFSIYIFYTDGNKKICLLFSGFSFLFTF